MGKKVCILPSIHPPFDMPISYKQAKKLTKTDYEVTLIARHDKDKVSQNA